MAKEGTMIRVTKLEADLAKAKKDLETSEKTCGAWVRYYSEMKAQIDQAMALLDEIPNPPPRVSGGDEKVTFDLVTRLAIVYAKSPPSQAFRSAIEYEPYVVTDDAGG